ncbi:MAG: hypothetical protein AAFW97_14265 [Pseudomonadota bacterium]
MGIDPGDRFEAAIQPFRGIGAEFCIDFGPRIGRHRKNREPELFVRAVPTELVPGSAAEPAVSSISSIAEPTSASEKPIGRVSAPYPVASR